MYFGCLYQSHYQRKPLNDRLYCIHKNCVFVNHSVDIQSTNGKRVSNFVKTRMKF